MYVGLKQPRGDGERCVTPARAAAKETRCSLNACIPLAPLCLTMQENNLPTCIIA